MSSIPITPITPKRTITPTINFATAGLGGCLAWAIIHPVNTIAVRSSLASMRGEKFSLSGMIKKNGAMSVYDGLSAGLWRQLVYATSRFGLFEVSRDKLHEYRGKTDFGARVVLGATTGGAAAYLSCPMEVCVVRMSNDATLAVADRRNYKGVVDVATRIAKEEGVSAFWRGSTPFVQRAMMVGVFQVATYDQFKGMFASNFNQKKDSMLNVFSASMTSGFIYSVFTMPLEAAKNRMASQKIDPKTGKLPYTGVLQLLTTVAQKEGPLALFAGYFPYYLRCGGHTVFMFSLVQVLRDAYTSQ